MDRADFFAALWRDFERIAPQAAAIRQQLESSGERVENDHVAFRSFEGTALGIEALEPVILALGYRQLDEYRFEAKHLRARAYLCPGSPRIFLSELLSDELGPGARETIAGLVAEVPAGFVAGPEVFWAGRPWPPLPFADYQRLADESEYAGWLAALGLRPNHFTVSINALEALPDVASVLAFVEDAGYAVNEAGGRVKGTPEDLLEQGSTLADRVEVAFADGTHRIPTCYYEFALRHRDAGGALYQGFVPASADRIFESTSRR